jgi:hypothetical protein
MTTGRAQDGFGRLGIKAGVMRAVMSAAAIALSGPAEGHRIEQTGLRSLLSGALLEHEADGRFVHAAASREGTNEPVGRDRGRPGEEPVHDLIQVLRIEKSGLSGH